MWIPHYARQFAYRIQKPKAIMEFTSIAPLIALAVNRLLKRAAKENAKVGDLEISISSPRELPVNTDKGRRTDIVLDVSLWVGLHAKPKDVK